MYSPQLPHLPPDFLAIIDIMLLQSGVHVELLAIPPPPLHGVCAHLNTRANAPRASSRREDLHIGQNFINTSSLICQSFVPMLICIPTQSSLQHEKMNVPLSHSTPT